MINKKTEEAKKNTEKKTDIAEENIRKGDMARKKKKMGRTGKTVLIVLAVYLLVMLAALYFIDGRHVRFYLTEDAEIEQEYGAEFEDPGRYAVTVGRLFGESGRKLRVKTVGAPDMDKVGSYEIEYVTHYLFREYSTKRIVNVVDTTAPKISLEYKEGYTPSWFDGYEEEGYTAFDRQDGDITDKVERKIVDGRIEYSVTDSSGNTATETRKSSFTDSAPVLSLNGDESIEIYASPYFRDPGASAADSQGNDLSGYIQTEGLVLPYKAGEYELSYYIENAQGDRVQAARHVNILPAVMPETVEPDENTIYLTFDDGPGPYTDALLDVLAKYDVKVTFFVTCLNPDYSDCIGRAYREGHSIGAHTASHDYYTVYASEEAFFDDMARVQELIYAQTGSYTSLSRFPGGSSNTVSNFNPGIMSRLVQAVSEAGYSYFDWNVSSGDAGETTDTNQVVENVINGCAGRKVSVVLQHDIKDYSVNAVEQIIIWGIRNGYTFRALDAQSPTAHHGVAN